MIIADPQTLQTLLERRFEGERLEKLADLPLPSQFLGMDKAADRIALAAQKSEAITVVGDYDADGVCAAAILSETLESCGVQHEVIIPDRFSDGYGLSVGIVDRIRSGVAITVDNGISAHAAAKRAKEKGLTLIITDHHVCPETLPEAYAIVNPKQPGCPFPFKEPCGAAVAWYLGAAIKARLNPTLDISGQLELVAIATLADSVPLTGFNRMVTRAGLTRLNNSRRPFALALKVFLDKPVFHYDDIGFQIAPRINAAGRMDHARVAFDFLRAQTLDGAQKQLQILDRLNRERKEVESTLLTRAQDQAIGHEAAIVAHGEGWHEGVIGIVAARLAQRFKKPAVVISHDQGAARGSARISGEADLFGLIAQCGEHLEGFGGHKKAAGMKLSSDRIDGFKNAFLQAATQVDPTLLILQSGFLGELRLGILDIELYELIRRYEPFGEGNPQPLFLARDLAVVQSRTMGQKNQHLRLRVAENRAAAQAEAVAFFTDRQISEGGRASFYYTLGLNEFNGNRRIQMGIREFI